MSGDNQSHGGGSHDRALKGWDKGAFWYPTLDKRGALLGLAAVLFVLHFGSLFGIYRSSELLFGWLPVTFGYHLVRAVLHIGFMVLIYLNWPEPADKSLDPGTAEADVTPPGAAAEVD